MTVHKRFDWNIIVACATVLSVIIGAGIFLRNLHHDTVKELKTANDSVREQILEHSLLMGHPTLVKAYEEQKQQLREVFDLNIKILTQRIEILTIEVQELKAEIKSMCQRVDQHSGDLRQKR